MARKTIKESKQPAITEPPETIPEKTSDETQWIFRWMCSRDMSAVVRIEKQCFENDAWNAIV